MTPTKNYRLAYLTGATLIPSGEPELARLVGEYDSLREVYTARDEIPASEMPGLTILESDTDGAWSRCDEQ